jgi:hypothetical protein
MTGSSSQSTIILTRGGKSTKRKNYSQKNKKTTNPNKSGVNSGVPESSCFTNVSVVVLLNIP